MGLILTSATNWLLMERCHTLHLALPPMTCLQPSTTADVTGKSTKLVFSSIFISQCNLSSSFRRDKPELLVKLGQTHHRRVVCQFHQPEAFPIRQHDNQMNNSIKHNSTHYILVPFPTIHLLLHLCNSRFSSWNWVDSSSLSSQFLLFHLLQKRMSRDYWNEVLLARCSSWHPTTSVKALNGIQISYPNQWPAIVFSSPTTILLTEMALLPFPLSVYQMNLV